MGLRILVVDDHEPVRRSITSILPKRSDWQVCREASNGMEAVTRAKALRPDAVLMDVSMPVMDGLQATREVRKHLPNAKIVLVSQNDPAVVRQQPIQVRADACVEKDKLTEHLIHSVAQLFPEATAEPTDPATKSPGEEEFAWLQGGGKMGELIRDTDWTRTPLGAAPSWSPALRMIVRFLLANRFPQLLWWGPEFCSIYNDA